jgi:hypothetical protein
VTAAYGKRPYGLVRFSRDEDCGLQSPLPSNRPLRMDLMRSLTRSAGSTDGFMLLLTIELRPVP